MSLILVGTNHRYSPIELREKIAFSKKGLKDALFFLRERGVFRGAVILSTCNRVEIYASVKDKERGIREIEYFISRYHEIDMRKFLPYLYIYEDKEAMKHLFSVAPGLDSLVLGEAQILGQVKFALSEGENVGFVDGFLRDVFYSAISLAKRVHSETELSKGKVSVGSVAVDFIKEKTGNLSGKNILIVGVGKVTELVLKYLKKEASVVVFVSNRTFEKAKYLASLIGAKAVRFNELEQSLKYADIVITATGSPHFVIKKDSLLFTHHSLLILDLAVPRDVDPRVKELENIDLFCLEDLDSVINKNSEKKIQEAKKAERLWKEFTESEPEPALLP